MSPVRSLLRLPATTASVRSFSHTTYISGPPRVRIPFWEKCVHGVVIAAGVLAGPMWILAHLEDYKKRD